MAPAAGVSDTEHFWYLIDKADRKFSNLHTSPVYSRKLSDPDFHKAFKIYTRLWKLQQEHRQKLLDAGFNRWEIGEIASRIAQLYYVQYQRTSDVSNLFECYLFYEAVLTREYFRDGMQEPGLAGKQMRFLVRFLVVCLLLARRGMVMRLANQLRGLVDDCRKNFPNMEMKEWKQAVHEVHRFLKVDTPFMNMRPLRYSFIFDAPPDSLPSMESSNTKRCLTDIFLCSYHHHEIKFAELGLDTFRMLQCFEWEPCGSFTLPSGPSGESGSGQSHLNHSMDIRDPTLPPNPKKAILHRPSVTQYLLVLATICEELPPNGILLVYLSAAGKDISVVSSQSGPSLNSLEDVIDNFYSVDMTSQTKSDSLSESSPNKGEQNNKDDCCLWLSSRENRDSGCLYPCDLIPFTRKPIFLIIDSDVSHSFKVIHGSEKGETAALFLSPISEVSLPSSPTNSSSSQNASQFTMFLTTPLQGFCFLAGVPTTTMDKDVYQKAEKVLLSAFKELELALTSSNALHPVWLQALGDPFLRRLLLRFVFYRTALALSPLTCGKSEFLPECLPALPECVLPESQASQSAIKKVAEFFDVGGRFFSVGTSST